MEESRTITAITSWDFESDLILSAGRTKLKSLFQFSNLVLTTASLVAQMVKNLPTMWEARVRSLDHKDWQPTPIFLPGKSHGQRSLEGYSSWGCKRSDMT